MYTNTFIPTSEKQQAAQTYTGLKISRQRQAFTEYLTKLNSKLRKPECVSNTEKNLVSSSQKFTLNKESLSGVHEELPGNETKNIQGTVDEICKKYLEGIKESDLNFRAKEHFHVPEKSITRLNLPIGISISEEDIAIILKDKAKEQFKVKENNSIGRKDVKSELPAKQCIVVRVPFRKSVLPAEFKRNEIRKTINTTSLVDRALELPVTRVKYITLPPGMSISAEDIAMFLKKKRGTQEEKQKV